MQDGHSQATRHLSGEDDAAGTDGPDRGSRRRGVLEPAVPRAVGTRWLAERVEDRCDDGRAIALAVGAPAVGTSRAGVGRRSRGPRRGDHPRSGHDDEHHEGAEPARPTRSGGGAPPGIEHGSPRGQQRWRRRGKRGCGADSAEDQAGSRSSDANRDRRCSTALVWIWQTRDSVTPRTRPISERVRLS